MATNYLTLRGTVKWTKVYEYDEYAGAKNWKVSFYPANQAEWDKYNKAQLQLVKKTDIDGEYITFRRPVQKLIKDDLVIFSPPEITGEITVKYVDENGEKVRQYNKGDKIKVLRVDEDGNEIEGDIRVNSDNGHLVIGNGSEVLLNFSYYTTVKGSGHRLESLKILDLVPVQSSNDEDHSNEKEMVKAVKKVIKDEAKPKKVKEEKTLKEELNDDLPW